jgi:hypothetical protein
MAWYELLDCAEILVGCALALTKSSQLEASYDEKLAKNC